MKLTNDPYIENSLSKLKDHFVESPTEIRNFKALVSALAINYPLKGPAKLWQDFAASPQNMWRDWSFIYDRKSRVILPVHYGGHTGPAALLYAFYKKHDIAEFVRVHLSPYNTSNVEAEFADWYHEEGFGATYGPGRGLIYGSRFPLSHAEKRVFSGVKTSALEVGEPMYTTFLGDR